MVVLEGWALDPVVVGSDPRTLIFVNTRERYSDMSNSQMFEVTGTTRNPDGAVHGRLDGLVAKRQGQIMVLTMEQSIALAGVFQLYCEVPGDGQLVLIHAVDTDGDHRNDSVRTAPDKTTRNNLLELPIWDRRRSTWIQVTRAA